MNNFFISEAPYTQKKPLNSLTVFTNKVLKKLLGLRLQHVNDFTVDMNNLEQRMNYFHLVRSVIDMEVEGEFVELGSFTGQCALLIANTMKMYDSKKEFHLYDSFEVPFKEKEGSIEQTLIQNFKSTGLPMPFIHKGRFEKTVPSALPDKIAFAHIDCGFGGDPNQHKEVVLYCLHEIYPRMTSNSICVLMDYYEPNSYNYNVNPGAGMAADEFLKDKPEKIISLFAGECAHGYFKKK